MNDDAEDGVASRSSTGESVDRALAATERKVRLGFAFALACLGVVGVVSYLSVIRLTENADRVEHSRELLSRIELLLAAVTDSETAERGYVITGDAHYLEPYTQSARVVDAQIGQLRGLTKSSALQRQWLDSVVMLVTERLSNLRGVIALRRDRGFDDAQREILTGKGKRFHDRIRTLIDNMTRIENTTLIERERLARRSATLTQFVIIGGSVLALALAGLALFAIRRDFAGRAQAERALRSAKDQLETRVRERTAELVQTARDLKIEIGERSAAQEKLQAQLQRLNLLQQITGAIGERQDIQSIFQVVAGSLEEQLPVDFCCICLYEPAQNRLAVSSVGPHSAALATELAMTAQTFIPVDQNGLLRCVSGQLVYEPDISRVPFAFPQRLNSGGLQSLVAAPLRVESLVFGVLVAARREADSFSSGDCEFLKQLSEHVALAAHQAQLNSALQTAYDELRATQQAVMQQERLRALGQMASGIAHDINNAISPVTLYTESLLEKEPSLSPRTREYLQTIQRAIDDVAQTVARLREFYRLREPQLTLVAVDLNRLAKQVTDLTRPRWSDMAQQRGVSIEVRSTLQDNLPLIMGIESELREALTNLIFNAVDAMPEGGTLTLRSYAADAGVVCIEVIDTGVGMDEKTRRQCLEPFFTTKGERGTGLGLAMVYGVVQRHSADLEIESIVGQGTTVRLSFTVPNQAVADPLLAPQAATLERLHILIVDDDPVLLKSLADTLEVDGHTVTMGRGGQAGIDTFRVAHERGEKFDVVITDLGMPQVDGRKVASAIKALAPAMPVILLTGWGQRLIADGDIPPGIDQVLSKPPKLRELREALGRCRLG